MYERVHSGFSRARASHIGLLAGLWMRPFEFSYAALHFGLLGILTR